MDNNIINKRKMRINLYGVEKFERQRKIWRCNKLGAKEMYTMRPLYLKMHRVDQIHQRPQISEEKIH